MGLPFHAEFRTLANSSMCHSISGMALVGEVVMVFTLNHFQTWVDDGFTNLPWGILGPLGRTDSFQFWASLGPGWSLTPGGSKMFGRIFRFSSSRAFSLLGFLNGGGSPYPEWRGFNIPSGYENGSRPRRSRRGYVEGRVITPG